MPLMMEAMTVLALSSTIIIVGIDPDRVIAEDGSLSTKAVEIIAMLNSYTVIFIEENGRVVMENATKVALREVQDAFSGKAE